MSTGAAPCALFAAVLCVGALPAAAGDGAVGLSVLSYNTHGLPGWIAWDEPERRFPEIARRLQAYDLVLLQEDFAHHELLVANVGHRYVLRGNAPRNRWVNGDGLTILAAPSLRAVEPRLRHPYGTCSGWLNGASDCFATKGLFGVRVTLSNGTTLDAYDLHLEAGRGEEDRRVRHEQLDQVERKIREGSPGRAMIVAGDFNMRDADADERTRIERFRRALGLEDAEIDPRGSTPWTKRIDYLFFRSGDSVELELLEAGVAREFVHEQGPLSDHPALYARFGVVARGAGPPPVAAPEDGATPRGRMTHRREDP